MLKREKCLFFLFFFCFVFCFVFCCCCCFFFFFVFFCCFFFVFFFTKGNNFLKRRRLPWKISNHTLWAECTPLQATYVVDRIAEGSLGPTLIWNESTRKLLLLNKQMSLEVLNKLYQGHLSWGLTSLSTDILSRLPDRWIEKRRIRDENKSCRRTG